MAGDAFWNNRDQAQKLITEATTLRKKIEPLQSAEKRVEDFKVMIELGEGEPADAQTKLQEELQRDLESFIRELDEVELRVLLNGPYDKNNCIVNINAGAGGTESCDWASMLMRMYQRWAESARLGSGGDRRASR
jgi:peptide chain release factor 2